MLVSSTAPRDWQFSKGRLTIETLAPGYLLFLQACGWVDKPTSACDEWWVGHIRDGAIYIHQAGTGVSFLDQRWRRTVNPLVNIDFRPAERTLTLSYGSNGGAERTDVYQSAAGLPNTDQDLARRMARAKENSSDTVKSGEFTDKWDFDFRVTH